jgi:hypothetical protein
VLVDHHITSSSIDADPDALFGGLDAEDDAAFRAARAQQLASELSKLRPNNSTTSSAAEAYITLRSDEEVLRFTTDTDSACCNSSIQSSRDASLSIHTCKNWHSSIAIATMAK